MVGIFAFFASSFVSAHLGAQVPWIWFALLMLLLNAVLTYFDLLFAVAAKYLAPARYEIIGRIVLEDSHERD